MHTNNYILVDGSIYAEVSLINKYIFIIVMVKAKTKISEIPSGSEVIINEESPCPCQVTLFLQPSL